MCPFIKDGDILEVEPIKLSALRPGDVAFFRRDGGVVQAHRVVRRVDIDGVLALLTKGDSRLGFDDVVYAEQVLGRVVVVERETRRIRLDSSLCRLTSWFYVKIAPFGLWIHKIRIRAKRAGCVLRKIAAFSPLSPRIYAVLGRLKRAICD
jgi:signal peptidase